MADRRLDRFKLPLLALILGAVPFFLFIGTSETLKVNGVLVRDEQLNIGGLVLAAIGLWFAVRSFRARPDFKVAGVAGLAAVVCALQLLVSSDFVSRDSIAGWFGVDTDLPPLQYAGLDETNRNIPESVLENRDQEGVRQAIISYTASMLMDVNLHTDYADACHDGDYRLDAEAMRTLPALLTDADREEIAARVEADRRAVPETCNPQDAQHRMGEVVDAANKKQDMIEILVAGYRERYQ